MFKLICVTNRKLCVGDFTDRIAELHKNGVAVILREKDLSEREYIELTRSVIKVCPDVVIHSYVNAAAEFGVGKIHLPFNMLNGHCRLDFEAIGVSVHSAKEAVQAEKLGASYVTAGHIFETDCKIGIAPRGTEFLKSVVSAVNIPVYGIGGISPDNIGLIKEAGAAGGCIMSGFMRCESIEKYLEQIYKNILKKRTC